MQQESEKPELDIGEVLKLYKKGKKLLIGARGTHKTENGILIEEGRIGKLEHLADWDAPDYKSQWGYGISIDWGDPVGSQTYNDYFATNGYYNTKENKFEFIHELFWLVGEDN